MSRELPESISTDEVADAYGTVIDHCSSCHEDLEYGFTEAIEPVVVRMPDNSLRTIHDSCCQLIRDLKSSEIPHLDGWEFERGSATLEAKTPPATTTEGEE